MAVVRVLVLALLLGQVTGLWSHALSDDDCEPGCADDDAGKDCPPACPTCACACTMRLLSFAATPTELPRSVPAMTRIAPRANEAAPASPDPREILHVPRPRLA